MNIIGAMRVKNEARWIRRSIESIKPICSEIIVLDDGSSDGTGHVARAAGATVFDSVYRGLDEVRDKNYLLDLIGLKERKADWILMIDGDEALQDSRAATTLLQAMQTTRQRALALPILYLWDGDSQIRVDGVYGTMSRVSAFRPGNERFAGTGGPNFHCGNAPQGIMGRDLVHAPLLHYGYMYKQDRLRKYAWYNEKDPQNSAEDQYRHIVQGDIPEVPANARLMHAGPLNLRSRNYARIVLF